MKEESMIRKVLPEVAIFVIAAITWIGMMYLNYVLRGIFPFWFYILFIAMGAVAWQLPEFHRICYFILAGCLALALTFAIADIVPLALILVNGALSFVFGMVIDTCTPINPKVRNPLHYK